MNIDFGTDAYELSSDGARGPERIFGSDGDALAHASASADMSDSNGVFFVFILLCKLIRSRHVFLPCMGLLSSSFYEN